MRISAFNMHLSLMWPQSVLQSFQNYLHANNNWMWEVTLIFHTHTHINNFCHFAVQWSITIWSAEISDILDESPSCNNLCMWVVHNRAIEVQICTQDAATAWQKTLHTLCTTVITSVIYKWFMLHTHTGLNSYQIAYYLHQTYYLHQSSLSHHRQCEKKAVSNCDKVQLIPILAHYTTSTNVTFATFHELSPAFHYLHSLLLQ